MFMICVITGRLRKVRKQETLWPLPSGPRWSGPFLPPQAASADPSSLFKSLLGRFVLLRMIRARLQPGEVELAQPFADRAFRHGDRKAPGHFRAQIDAAPADDFVGLGIGTGLVI